MLGFAVVLGMGLSTVQMNAMGMSMAGMSMAGTTMPGMNDCGGCKDTPSGAKNTICDAACAASIIAVTPQVSTPVIRLTMDRPLLQSPMQFGWTASPNPHPPKLALI